MAAEARISTEVRQTASDRYGSGPPLVLVHGDRETNWEFVKLLFANPFTVYAVALLSR